MAFAFELNIFLTCIRILPAFWRLQQAVVFFRSSSLLLFLFPLLSLSIFLFLSLPLSPYFSFSYRLSLFSSLSPPLPSPSPPFTFSLSPSPPYSVYRTFCMFVPLHLSELIVKNIFSDSWFYRRKLIDARARLLLFLYCWYNDQRRVKQQSIGDDKAMVIPTVSVSGLLVKSMISRKEVIKPSSLRVSKTRESIKTMPMGLRSNEKCCTLCEQLS